MARTPEQQEEYNRKRRERRRADSRAKACRHAARVLISSAWGGGPVPAVTPADVADQAEGMYGNYRDLRDFTADEARQPLIDVLESKGLPVLLTTEEQEAATSVDAMVVGSTAGHAAA